MLFNFYIIAFVRVNDAVKFLLILFKVSIKTQTVQTLIPVEPFQNVPEDQQKVGVVIYDSDEQFNVTFFICSSDCLNLFLTPSLIYNLPVCGCVFTAE